MILRKNYNLNKGVINLKGTYKNEDRKCECYKCELEENSGDLQY